MITENVNAVNKFIVNNRYNNNLELNGTLTINSNLIVLGDTTRLETVAYTTERLEVVNANNTSTAFMVQQNSADRDIFVASNMNTAVFRIANNGNVNTNGSMTIRGDIIPASNVVYNLGSAQNSWKDLYLSGNSIYLNNTVLSSDSGADLNIKDGSGVYKNININTLQLNGGGKQITLGIDETGRLTYTNASNVTSFAITTTSVTSANLDTSILNVDKGGTGVGTLASGQLLIGNGTSNVLQTSNLRWDNTNNRLGIGTSAPENILHISDASTSNTKLTIQNSFVDSSVSLTSTLPPEIVVAGAISSNIGTTERYIMFPYSGTGTSKSYTFTTTENLVCDILVVGGGGGGGYSYIGGGGGSGGYVYSSNINMTVGNYTINVGAGGKEASSTTGWFGGNGGNSSITGGINYTALGGGGGAGGSSLGGVYIGKGNNGGSGGGGSISSVASGGGNSSGNGGTSIQFTTYGYGSGGDGTTYIPTSNAQIRPNRGGNGGGASGISLDVSGGDGLANNITGVLVTYAGGGGGGNDAYVKIPGGLGGGGAGSDGNGLPAVAGADGFGGGGGGARGWASGPSAKGGSGIVIIRYRMSSTTSSTSASIELIRGAPNDSNTDYKIGNYEGEFKIMSSTSNVDISRLHINSSGNVGIGTSAPIANLHITDANISNTKLTIQNTYSSNASSVMVPVLPNEIVVEGTTSATTGMTDRYIMFPYTTDSSGLTGQTQYTFTTTENFQCDILLIGGGGGGANGGGGGGGFVYTSNVNMIPGNYTVRVGNGGSGLNTRPNSGTQGYHTSISGGVITSNLIAYGGGGGGGGAPTHVLGQVGSFGGSGIDNPTRQTFTSPQGNRGGSAIVSSYGSGGGGGGAGGVGSDAVAVPSIDSYYNRGGQGGNGRISDITGNLIYYAGGGTAGTNSGGGTDNSPQILPIGGGGLGSRGPDGNGSNGTNGLGGGGGGGDYERTNGGNGGSGIVIIRYRSYTPATSASIELIRGDSGDGNTDYKIGNYGGYFKIMTSTSNVDVDRLFLTSTGNLGLGTSTPDTNLHINDINNNNTKLKIQNNYNYNYIPTLPAEIVVAGATSTQLDSFNRCISFPYSGTASTKDYIFKTTQNLLCDILIVGGGGGGSAGQGAGGGAGQLVLIYQATLNSGSYTIKVGKGGIGGVTVGGIYTGASAFYPPTKGIDSSFDYVIAEGGGANTNNVIDKDGGSGAGGDGYTMLQWSGEGTSGRGNKNTTFDTYIGATVYSKGNDGGNQGTSGGWGGGGGGAGQAGVAGGPGGNGLSGIVEIGFDFKNKFGTSLGKLESDGLVWFAGGGGSGGGSGGGFPGGLGGGGLGKVEWDSVAESGVNGTGSGGGGGAGFYGDGGNGGSGIVIIRYSSAPTKTSASIELIQGTSADSNTDYKLGNYSGDFKIMTSTSNVDINSLLINSKGEMTLSSNLLIQSRIGIGTPSPTSKLEVYGGDIRLNTNWVTGATMNVLGINTDRRLEFSYNNGTSLYDTNKIRFLTGTSLLERMVIDTSGTVGIIGNTTVGGSSTITGNMNVAGTILFNMNWTGGVTANLMAYNSDKRLEFSFNDGTALYDNNKLRFFTANTQRMTIATNGNVGIGTATPSQRVHIVHPSNSLVRIETDTSAVSQVSGIEFGIPSYSSATRSKITSTTYAGDASDLQFYTSSSTSSSTSRMAITSNGFIGIGTATPSQRLHVVHPSNNLVRIETNSNAISQVSGIEFGIPSYSSATRSKITSTTYAGDASDLQFYTSSAISSSTTRMMITSNGNVGIGTNPQNKLHIGDTNIDNTKMMIQNNFVFPPLCSEIVVAGTTSKIIGVSDRTITFPYTTDTSGTSQTQYTFTTTESFACDILLVGGGGGGGSSYQGGGGGGGGYVYLQNLTLPIGTYNVNVGNGGVAGTTGWGGNGNNSTITGGITYTAIGGGGGAGGSALATITGIGNSGGSGGGGSYRRIGNTPAEGGASTQFLTYGYGNGGNGNSYGDIFRYGGGGGGASGITKGASGIGNDGLANSITGVLVTYAGGGGAGYDWDFLFPGGAGGGGSGGNGLAGQGNPGGVGLPAEIGNGATRIYPATAGTNGLGGGGGGAPGNTISSAGSGGSGIVIIRYRRFTEVGYVNPISSASIELTRGLPGDANTDYKLGNYSGDFRIMSSASNVDTNHLLLTSNGNITVSGSINAATKYLLGGRNILEDTSNYVLSTSNIINEKIAILNNSLLSVNENSVNTIINETGAKVSLLCNTMLAIGKLNNNNINTTVTSFTENTTSKFVLLCNTMFAIGRLNDANVSNYILASSLATSNKILADVKATNSTVSRTDNLEVNGNLTVNSNLIVLGDSTRLETTVYTTERLEIVNANNTSTAFMVQQNTADRDILVASNMSTAVFRIANNGNVNMNGRLGIGTATPATPLHVIGDIVATQNITSYYSDERLKTKIAGISDPLKIIDGLNGFYYIPNELARINGITNTDKEIGLSAQDVQKVLPEIVKIAPFDLVTDAEGNKISRSGEKYLTMSYERLAPVFVEAIKELAIKNATLEQKHSDLEQKHSDLEQKHSDLTDKYNILLEDITIIKKTLELP
jgi:hypothetical protein